jgi:hypothetical protein
MALGSIGWFLTVELVDRGNNSTTRTFELVSTDTAGDASAVLTAVGTILTRLNAVTAAVVKSYSVSKRFVEAALTLPTSAEAEVEKHALITALIYQQPNESASIDIPAPEQGIFLAQSGPNVNLVDFADTDVQNYLDIFDYNAPLAKISDGEQIDKAVVKGRRTSSKSGKG